jgi:hypothetical protein
MMKTHRVFRILLIFVGLTASATAHLGESKTEIARRLGKGKSYRSRGGWEQREYPKNGMTTYVVFANDKSIWELTKRNDKKISESDIQALLKDAATPGHPFIWHADQKCYLSDGGKVRAQRQPRHDDFFSILNVEAVTGLEDVSEFVCLGKTADEVDQRYGPGAVHQPREGMEQRVYGKNGYTIQVVFKNGRSVWELFKREDRDVTNDDIVKILTAGGGGFLWDDEAKCFFRDGKRLQAQREPGHPDFFSMKDKDAIAR